VPAFRLSLFESRFERPTVDRQVAGSIPTPVKKVGVILVTGIRRANIESHWVKFVALVQRRFHPVSHQAMTPSCPHCLHFVSAGDPPSHRRVPHFGHTA